MDEESLIVIERFKEALLPKVSSRDHESGDFNANRGNKLQLANPIQSLHPKVVEYGGENHLIYTNEAIERSTKRRRRKWKEMYGPVNSTDGSSVDKLAASDDESDTDENPFKHIKLSDILAPLNHPLELVSHPAILKIYKLPVYARLASDLINVIEVEQSNLNQLNKLLYVLNGEDWHYILDENLGLEEYDHNLTEEKSLGVTTKTEPEIATTKSATEAAILPPTKVSPTDSVESRGDLHVAELERKENSASVAAQKALNTTPTISDNIPDTIAIQGLDGSDPFFALPKAFKDYELRGSRDAIVDKETTIIQEDLINYLQVSVQRQYEYIKNLTKIRNGVVRAERLKENLSKWGKEMHDKRST